MQELSLFFNEEKIVDTLTWQTCPFFRNAFLLMTFDTQTKDSTLENLLKEVPRQIESL